MEIEKIFVLGAGVMGSGIAQVCGQAGYSVTLCDLNQGIVEKAMKNIAWSVGKFIEKGRIKGTVEEITGRIKTANTMDAARGADFVFEAIFENVEVKRQAFGELDKICPPHTIFATNTSVIPVTEIAEATGRAEKVVGTHFFNPVPMMNVVEIIKGVITSNETVEVAEKVCRKMGKDTVRVKRDVAGFLLNRINIPSIIEAINMLEQGIGTVEDIDKGMRLGFGRAMGIFETQDLTGLDVSMNAYLNLYNDTKDPKFYPPALLRRKVKAGQLGRKTGVGWYRYDETGKRLGPAD